MNNDDLFVVISSSTSHGGLELGGGKGEFAGAD